MNLEEFVSESLAQIVRGVQKAQETTRETGATINPVQSGYGSPSNVVEFDIAVTVVAGTETKGAIGVFAGAIGLGSQGQSNASNTSLSRVKFSVPVRLPKVVAD